MRAAQPLVGENVEVFPPPLGWSGSKLFGNPDQVIDPRFQLVTIRTRVVVAIVDAWISFRRQNVGVAKNFVENNAFAGGQVCVVVFDKGDRAQGRGPSKTGMVKRGHVKAPGVVTHLSKLELQGKIECAGAAIHPPRIKYPA